MNKSSGKANPNFKRLWIGFGIMAVFMGGLVIYGYAQPKEYEVVRSVEIDGDRTKVWDYIADLKQWDVWLRHDFQEKPKQFFTGTPGDTSHALNWDMGKGEANGSIKFTKVSGDTIQYDMVNGMYTNKGEFVISKKGDKCVVIWKDYGEIDSPLQRIVPNQMDKTVGVDMEKQLARLKKLVELGKI